MVPKTVLMYVYYVPTRCDGSLTLLADHSNGMSSHQDGARNLNSAALRRGAIARPPPRERYAKQRRTQCFIIPRKLGMPLIAATLLEARTSGLSWAAMRPLCSASGAKNGARPSRPTCPAISSY